MFILRLRFWTAAAAVLVMNLKVFGFSFRKLCAPGFNCQGCPWASFACPVGVLTFGAAVRTLPVLALSGVLAVGILTGRLVCGFCCPFGWLQDLLHRLPGRKLRLPRWTRWLRYAALALLVVILPYLLGFERSGYLRLDEPRMAKGADGTLTVTVGGENLGERRVSGVSLAMVYFEHGTGDEVLREEVRFADFAVAAGEAFELPGVTLPDRLATADLLVSSPQSTVHQTPRYQLYFCRFCPKGTLTASLLPRLSGQGTGEGIYAGGWFSWRYLLLFAFLALMIVASRPFCRMMCPLGAMYGLLTPVAVTGFKVDLTNCTQCRWCDRVCPVGLDVRREIGGPDCIACGDCLRRCPHDCLKRRLLPGRHESPDAAKNKAPSVTAP